MKCQCQVTLLRGGCENYRNPDSALCWDCIQRGCDGPELRTARIADSSMITKERVRQYLPTNYWVKADDQGRLYVEGFDDHGWTLDGYVIPRLASGMIPAHEVVEA